jgi:hypothetical protein
MALTFFSYEGVTKSKSISPSKGFSTQISFYKSLKDSSLNSTIWKGI